MYDELTSNCTCCPLLVGSRGLGKRPHKTNLLTWMPKMKTALTVNVHS